MVNTTLGEIWADHSSVTSAQHQWTKFYDEPWTIFIWMLYPMPFVNNLFLFTLRIGWKMEEFMHHISRSSVHNNDCLFTMKILKMFVINWNIILLLLLCWHLAPCLLLIFLLHHFSTFNYCHLPPLYALPPLAMGTNHLSLWIETASRVMSHMDFHCMLMNILYICVCVLIMQTWHPLNRQTGIEFKIPKTNNC